MKVARGGRQLFSLLAAFALLPVGTSFAQMRLTFDYSNLANPDYNGDNIFVTFAANASDLVFSGTSGSTSILFNTGTLSNGNVTSQSFTLNQLASGTLTVNSATSLIGYISYGTSAGFASGTTSPSPFTTAARYSNFEFTYAGSGTNSSGGADLTNIAQFGGSLKMETFAGATRQGYTQNSVNSGDLFRALAATASSSPSAVITTGTGGTGQFVRVVGPSKFPNSGINSPYPTYNNYLGSLYTSSNSGTNSVANLQNLQPGAAPGGSGSIGMTSTGTSGGVVSGTTYNADYYFNAYVSPVVTGSTTTYQVLLSGSVVMTPATSGTAVTYSGLGILLNADSGTNLYMTNFINQQTNTGAGINVSLTGTSWANLESAFSGATNTLSLKAEGDFSEGILTGLVGSLTTISGTAIGNMTSAQWWQNGLSAYFHAQTTNPFYNAFGEVIYDNSGGANTASVSGTFSDGGVYGNPYDDRFQTQLLGLNGSTSELRISLLADGNLNVVPEPATAALILSGASLIFGLRYLKRRGATAT